MDKSLNLPHLNDQYRQNLIKNEILKAYTFSQKQLLSCKASSKNFSQLNQSTGLLKLAQPTEVQGISKKESTQATSIQATATSSQRARKQREDERPPLFAKKQIEVRLDSKDMEENQEDEGAEGGRNPDSWKNHS